MQKKKIHNKTRKISYWKNRHSLPKDLKILHFSKIIPDGRVERIATLGNRLGCKSYFVGKKLGKTALKIDPFIEKFEVSIRPIHLVLPAWSKPADELKEVILKIKPDIIHAHDIHYFKFAEMVVKSLKLNISMVYDSHEYWSLQIKHRREGIKYYLNPVRLASTILQRILIPRWEKRFLRKYPVITVSEKIREEFLKKKGENVFVIHNMPLEQEIDNIEHDDVQSQDQIVLSYIGSPVGDDVSISYRDTTKLIQLFNGNNINSKLLIIGSDKSLSGPNINSIGTIEHSKCVRVLAGSHIGTQGFEPHEVLAYCDPNKVYQYAHAGLLILMPQIMLDNSLSHLKDISIGYNSLMDTANIIENNKDRILNHSHQKIRQWAREHLIMDKFQRTLESVYILARSKNN